MTCSQIPWPQSQCQVEPTSTCGNQWLPNHLSADFSLCGNNKVEASGSWWKYMGGGVTSYCDMRHFFNPLPPLHILDFHMHSIFLCTGAHSISPLTPHSVQWLWVHTSLHFTGLLWLILTSHHAPLLQELGGKVAWAWVWASIVASSLHQGHVFCRIT